MNKAHSVIIIAVSTAREVYIFTGWRHIPSSKLGFLRFQMNSRLAFWLGLLFAADGLPRSLSEFYNVQCTQTRRVLC